MKKVDNVIHVVYHVGLPKKRNVFETLKVLYILVYLLIENLWTQSNFILLCPWKIKEDGLQAMQNIHCNFREDLNIYTSPKDNKMFVLVSKRVNF